MDSVFETYLGADGMFTGAMAGAAAVASTCVEPDDIPKLDIDVWILGKSYNAERELWNIRQDIESRLWCTYRRGFVPLGEPQLTTDKGWGCMLRCGQMILAHALIDLHLGRNWCWTRLCRDPIYLKIVERFEDSRKSYFSIHQIALMGDSEDKKVGQWFGPNTVAQVLKKLVPYDDWSNLIIHVAMDSTVVLDDILKRKSTNVKEASSSVYPQLNPFQETSSISTKTTTTSSTISDDETDNDGWKPLLLMIPLRLGLNDINPIYIPALKKCFEMEENCGMIGGRPNQALYFLGYVGDEVLYLDPHTTQRSGSVGKKTSDDEIEYDATYHRKYAGRIPFSGMDPSLAICFLCKTRGSFQRLLGKLRGTVLAASNPPIFEIVQTRSPEWISSVVVIGEKQLQSQSALQMRKHQERTKSTDNAVPPFPNDDSSQDQNLCSDDDFEIIS